MSRRSSEATQRVSKHGRRLTGHPAAKFHTPVIEVAGRVDGADTITATKNEILYSLNKPDAFILAILAFSRGRLAHGAIRSSPVPA